MCRLSVPNLAVFCVKITRYLTPGTCKVYFGAVLDFSSDAYGLKDLV
jgi:hypothetical protein